MLHPGFKSIVYHGDSCLGEAEIHPVKTQDFQFPNNEIRINLFSPPSERCPPLSVLQTISPFGLRFKLESKSPDEESPLNRLHATCFRELKTAVVLIGGEELHLVAMPSKLEKFSCFWAFTVPVGLYNSCLGMLNMRCLGIVFDLDETLIVANTMRSFEDRIDAIQRKLSSETDPLRIAGMAAEMKRYFEDKALMKQYTENDHVIDNGRLIKVQCEEVPRLSDSHEPVVRPIIRLQERNIVLTRINPEVRDTSVLVRLRPAWEELRSYLTAKGRKRFEVYVCTMAERDYALEMWRLLDPEAHLINSKQLLDRIVCVKSGSRKSLVNVFQDGICHPKMAMVIDDRLKVWDDKDQPRVHVVPAFAPYYAPQAETANAVPVLCVARNVACNIRGGFFKEFDENLLRRISEICYEDEVADLPYAPDVSDYLMPEDYGGAMNGNRDLPVTEGMSDTEVEWRLKRMDEKFGAENASPNVATNNPDLRLESSLQHMAFPSNLHVQPASRTSVPVQRPSSLGISGMEREVGQLELDPNTRRRLLILQHGQDTRDHSSADPPCQSRLQILPAVLPRGGWLFIDEDTSPGQFNRRVPGPSQESNPLQPNKHQPHHTPFFRGAESSILSERGRHVPQVKVEEAYLGDDRPRQNHLHSSHFSFSEDDDVPINRASTSSTEPLTEAGVVIAEPSSVSVGVLQEIGIKCGTKVEFRSVVNSSKDLQFSVEVLFTGDKIGVGTGRTKKEAQQQAAENALHNLANKYVAHVSLDPGAVNGDLDKLSLGSENGFLMDIGTPGLEELARKEISPKASTSEPSGSSEDSKRLSRAVSALNELAAEEALGSLKSMVNQQVPKRANSPRAAQTLPTKRSKDELLQGLPGLSSSSRYHKNGHPVS